MTNRILTFSYKKFKLIPECYCLETDDTQFIVDVEKMTLEYIQLMEDIKLKEGLKHIMLISKLGNKYLQERQPWIHFKTNKNLCSSIIHISIHFLKHLATLIHAFLPDYSNYIATILKTECNTINLKIELNKLSGSLEKPDILFNKITEADVIKFKDLYT